MECRYLKQLWKWSLAFNILETYRIYESNIEPLWFLSNLDWNLSSKRKFEEDQVSYYRFNCSNTLQIIERSKRELVKSFIVKSFSCKTDNVIISPIDIWTLPWKLFLHLVKPNWYSSSITVIVNVDPLI